MHFWKGKLVARSCNSNLYKSSVSASLWHVNKWSYPRSSSNYTRNYNTDVRIFSLSSSRSTLRATVISRIVNECQGMRRVLIDCRAWTWLSCDRSRRADRHCPNRTEPHACPNRYMSLLWIRPRTTVINWYNRMQENRARSPTRFLLGCKSSGESSPPLIMYKVKVGRVSRKEITKMNRSHQSYSTVRWRKTG
jgi:hypothetical protein